MLINRTYFAAFILAVLFPTLLYSQLTVNRIDENFNLGNKDGMVYSLPQTLIQVDVVIEQKELLAGPLRNYAEEFMGIKNYISQDAYEYNISKISLSTIAEPDPAQYFFVSLGEYDSKEAWQTILEMNGHGMITSVGQLSNEPDADINGVPKTMSDEEIMQIFSKYADLNLYAKIDTVVRTINIDTVTIEDYTFRTTMTEKPLEVKAREVAEEIKKIREGRYNLLTGYQEVNYSEGALRYMNEELKKLEEEYLRLFTGAVIKSQLTYRFTFLPSADNLGSEFPLFRLSATNGVVIGGGGGEQVSIRVDAMGNTANLSANGGGIAGGLAYRIPEEAEVKIIYRSNTAVQKRIAISQLGRIASLPPGASNVQFDGETGGVKSIQLNAK